MSKIQKSGKLRLDLTAGSKEFVQYIVGHDIIRLDTRYGRFAATARYPNTAAR
jgi:hypothetical protein